MPFRSRIQSTIDFDTNISQLTIGEVVDTNDPQQMGRIRVNCPLFGDQPNTPTEDIPWATAVSPLGGSTSDIKRGREDTTTTGHVAYGMVNVPKVGAFAVVACIDGDPRYRIYLGCLHNQFLLHTLPHGRFFYNKTDNLTDEPSGPAASDEGFIQPLYDNQTEAFTKSSDTVNAGLPADPRKNYEYRTRGADVSVAGIDNEFLNPDAITLSQQADDKEVSFSEADGNTIENTQGYHQIRAEQNVTTDGDTIYDPQVYCWTTPGFHSFSMSDNSDSCRIRLRSTHGHQIIMDDTNERIYIGTASGKTWIEMDEKGNIDIYGERSLSVHAKKDINFTADDTFRVKAKNGIHMISEGEMRLHTTTGKIHMKSAATIELNSVADMSMSFPNLVLNADTNVDIKATNGTLNLESGGDLSVKSAGYLNFDSTSDTNVNSGGNITMVGTIIDLNGPPVSASAASAASATPSNTLEAWWTNRVPEHEPWARVMTKESVTDQDSGNTHASAAEYTYDDANVGRIERGEDLGRNPKWHR